MTTATVTLIRLTSTAVISYCTASGHRRRGILSPPPLRKQKLGGLFYKRERRWQHFPTIIYQVR